MKVLRRWLSVPLAFRKAEKEGNKVALHVMDGSDGSGLGLCEVIDRQLANDKTE